mgnify:CR=1 FL=1
MCNMGSSPLVRGRLGAHDRRQVRRGFIPARAGEALTDAARISGSQVHPRSCGGGDTEEILAQITKGSSPLVRGRLRRR